jgi:hypothetical protein
METHREEEVETQERPRGGGEARLETQESSKTNRQLAVRNDPSNEYCVGQHRV